MPQKIILFSFVLFLCSISNANFIEHFNYGFGADFQWISNSNSRETFEGKIAKNDF